MCKINEVLRYFHLYTGSGCFIRAVEAASNRPAIMLGKPETFLSEYITKKYNLNPERTLMIGDK